FEPDGVLDFSAGYFSDIEHIGDLIDVRRYLGDVNGEAETMQRMRDREENSDAIGGKDLHNREVVRCFVVNLNGGGNFRRAFLQKERSTGGFHQPGYVDPAFENA